MWALKVTRSTIAATRRGSGKTVPHSAERQVGPIAMEARSSPLGDDLEEQLGAAGVDLDGAELIQEQEVQAAVAADDAGQRSLVGGFDEFVDQGGGGDVADPAALLAGGQAEPDQQVRLAGAAWWPPSWAISSGPRPDSRIRRAGRARKYRRADPVRPASPARGLLPCYLCTNMWMTCAQRRRACAHTVEMLGITLHGRNHDRAFTWESASRILCMQRKPELSTCRVAIGDK
jgi:hypothetical protein